MSQKNAKRIRRLEERMDWSEVNADMLERRMDDAERDIRLNTYQIAHGKQEAAHNKAEKARLREENRMFLAIIFAFLAVLIMTMTVNAYMTGEPVTKQLYVAMHTSDTATAGEIQSVMQEADEIWP